MRKYIENEMLESIDVKTKTLNNETIIKQIIEVSQKIIEVYKNGGRIFFAGNGGSAADAQHLAGELVSKFYFDRPGLAAQALTTDTSVLTAIGNDYGYEKLFERQLQANATSKDVFIGITTSGNSKNIVKALEYTKKNSIYSVVFNGNEGGLIAAHDLADVNIIIPSNKTPKIQEVHIMIGHIICAIVEKELFGCKQ